jgi:hypothetical protein
MRDALKYLLLFMTFSSTLMAQLNLPKPELIAKFSMQNSAYPGGGVPQLYSPYFSFDGGLVIFSGDGILDVKKGIQKKLTSFQDERYILESNLSKNGKYLITLTQSNLPGLEEINVWETSSGKSIFNLSGNIINATLSSKGNFVISYELSGNEFSDRVIRIYDRFSRSMVFEKIGETLLDINNSMSSDEQYILTLAKHPVFVNSFNRLLVYRLSDLQIVLDEEIDKSTRNIYFGPDSRYFQF